MIGKEDGAPTGQEVEEARVVEDERIQQEAVTMAEVLIQGQRYNHALKLELIRCKLWPKIHRLLNILLGLQMGFQEF